MPWCCQVLLAVMCTGESVQGSVMLHTSPSSSLPFLGCECPPAATLQVLF